MNENYNIVRKLKERVLKRFYPVYHAPLVFDINTQSFYRKTGYVAWPKPEISEFDKIEKKEKEKNRPGRIYFAYPKSKSQSL